MAYIASIFLGTALVLLQSPIFFELLRRTITKGVINGALLGLGGFLAYFAILMVTVYWTKEFLLFDSIRFLLFLVGSIILMGIGIGALRMKQEEVYAPREIKKNIISKKIIKKNHPILAGFGIAISSPFDIAVWVSIGIAHIGSYSSKTLAFINIIFLALGVILVFFGIASLVYLARRRITARHILWVSKFFGIILIVYSLFFFFQFLKLLIV